MSQQIQLTGGAKVRNLQDVIIGTSGVLSSLAFDVANGVPRLDVNGKILVSQLPNSVMEYKGTWNAATNTPTLANGTGNQGDVYLCNVAGTVDFGAGPIAFVVGDQVIYSGSIWQRASGATGTVTSVAITESGDSLNITGSPITTSGTINIGFNGTNLQYVNGAGNLTTFPDLTGFVPYTGATGDVNLGLYSLTSNAIKVIGDNSTYGGTLSIKQSNVTNLIGVGYTELFGKTNRLGISFGAGSIAYLSNSTLTAERTYTLPDANGTIALTSDIPILTGYVPYTGATANVDLGVFDLTADLITGARGSFASSGGSDTFAINHSSGSGIALNITKGGNGEGLYINKTSGSGNAATIIGTLNATTLVKNGGTSSQFLKADGSVDSNTYALDSLVVHLAGTETITGAKTFSGAVTLTSSVTTNNITFANSGFFLTLQPPTLSVNRTVTLPNGTGTLALTSDLTGGTVTSVAALTIGTSGTDLSSSVANSTTTPVITLNVPTASATNRGALSSADWTTFNNKQGTITLTTTGTSGAATFTSNTLNIPNYGSALSGYLPLTGGTLTGSLTISMANYPQLILNSTNSNGPILKFQEGGVDKALIGHITQITGLQFSGNGSTAQATLDASGNLGLGVTPSAWNSIFNVIDFSATASLAGSAGGTNLFNNAYFDGTSYIYKTSNYATRYLQGVGLHAWYTSTTSGTVGNAITFTQAMTLNASGNLSIGNTNDTYKLDVSGTGRFSNADGSDLIRYSATGVNTNYATKIVSGANDVLVFRRQHTTAGALDIMALGYNGNVGIGTIGPNAKLTVWTPSSTGIQTALRLNNPFGFANQNTGAKIVFSQDRSAAEDLPMGEMGVGQEAGGTSAYGYMFFSTLNSTMGEKMRITSGGNVLIGTSTDAGYKLDVNGTGRFSGNLRVDGNTDPNSAAAAFFWNQPYLGPTISGYNFEVRTGNTGSQGRRLFINETGAATFSSSVTAAQLLISSSIFAGGADTNAFASSGRNVVVVNGSSQSLFGLTVGTINKGYLYHEGTNLYLQNIANGVMSFGTNDTERMRITSGGNVGIGTTSPSEKLTVSGNVLASGFFESSDSRLKTLIQDNYQTKGIASITPKLYTKNGKVELGYYAQDFVGILDSAVSKGSDDMLSLSYREVLVAKVYALEQRIKELETK